MSVTSKIRLYDLAKELKLDTKRLIEEVRREGVDVSVPSNSVSKELAEKIRNKYFTKKEAVVKRGVRVVKKAERAVEEAPPEVSEEPLAAEAEAIIPSPEPEAEPATTASPAAKPTTPARLVKKLTPAARAPLPTEAETTVPAEAETLPEMPGANGEPAEAASTEVASVAPVAAMPAPSRQVRVLRPTVAALNAGIRPGERAPTPVVTPPVTPRERAERGTRVRERTPLSKTERLGTPGETLTPQTTYIPPPDAGRRRSRRAPARGGRKTMEGKAGRFDKGDFIPPPKALSLEDRIAGRMEAPA